MKLTNAQRLMIDSLNASDDFVAWAESLKVEEDMSTRRRARRIKRRWHKSWRYKWQQFLAWLCKEFGLCELHHKHCGGVIEVASQDSTPYAFCFKCNAKINGNDDIAEDLKDIPLGTHP